MPSIGQYPVLYRSSAETEGDGDDNGSRTVVETDHKTNQRQIRWELGRHSSVSAEVGILTGGSSLSAEPLSVSLFWCLPAAACGWGSGLSSCIPSHTKLQPALAVISKSTSKCDPRLTATHIAHLTHITSPTSAGCLFLSHTICKCLILTKAFPSAL